MALNVLAFFAHPDDETMLCGGTLALLAKQGARVHVLIATRGEGGEMGEPPLCEREALGRVREDELRCAVQALGAESLTLMDYIDPTIGVDNQLFPFTDDLDQLAAQLIEALRRRKAAALITHGADGEYGHPAHVLVHQAARLAVHALADEAPVFYTVQGSFEDHPHPKLANASTPAHFIVDISSVMEQKVAAAMCHQTQHALFIRAASEEQGRRMNVPEVIHAVESLHRVSPPVAGEEAVRDPLADLLWAGQFARLPGKA